MTQAVIESEQLKMLLSRMPNIPVEFSFVFMGFALVSFNKKKAPKAREIHFVEFLPALGDGAGD
jgi:hypothetical protein